MEACLLSLHECAQGNFPVSMIHSSIRRMLQQHFISYPFSIAWDPHHTLPAGGMGGGNYDQGSGGGYNQSGGECAGHFMACLGWF